MDDYPTWWSSTLTLYNRYVDTTTHEVSWFPTVLHGCFYSDTMSSVVVDDIVVSARNTICRIPHSDAFLSKAAWDALADKSGNFTLGRGDILVNGEVDDLIDEYTKGMRSTDLLAKYSDGLGCFTIESVRINIWTNGVYPHYRVSGR